MCLDPPLEVRVVVMHGGQVQGLGPAVVTMVSWWVGDSIRLGMRVVTWCWVLRQLLWALVSATA